MHRRQLILQARRSFSSSAHRQGVLYARNASKQRRQRDVAGKPSAAPSTYVQMPTSDTLLLPTTAKMITLQSAPQLALYGSPPPLAAITHVDVSTLNSDMAYLSAYGRAGLLGRIASEHDLSPLEGSESVDSTESTSPSGFDVGAPETTTAAGAPLAPPELATTAAVMQWAIEDVSISLGTDRSIHEDLAIHRAHDSGKETSILMDDTQREFAEDMMDVLLETKDEHLQSVVDEALCGIDYDEDEGIVDDPTSENVSSALTLGSDDGAMNRTGESLGKNDHEESSEGWPDHVSHSEIAGSLELGVANLDIPCSNSPTSESIYEVDTDLKDIARNIQRYRSRHGPESYSDKMDYDAADALNLKLDSALGLVGQGICDTTRLELISSIEDLEALDGSLDNASQAEDEHPALGPDGIAADGYDEDLFDNDDSVPFHTFPRTDSTTIVSNNLLPLAIPKTAYEVADRINGKGWRDAIEAVARSAQLVRGTSTQTSVSPPRSAIDYVLKTPSTGINELPSLEELEYRLRELEGFDLEIELDPSDEGLIADFALEPFEEVANDGLNALDLSDATRLDDLDEDFGQFIGSDVVAWPTREERTSHYLVSMLTRPRLYPRRSTSKILCNPLLSTSVEAETSGPNSVPVNTRAASDARRLSKNPRGKSTLAQLRQSLRSATYSQSSRLFPRKLSQRLLPHLQFSNQSKKLSEGEKAERVKPLSSAAKR